MPTIETLTIVSDLLAGGAFIVSIAILMYIHRLARPQKPIPYEDMPADVRTERLDRLPPSLEPRQDPNQLDRDILTRLARELEEHHEQEGAR